MILPGELHGWRSLKGCNLWGCKELDTVEWLTLIHSKSKTFAFSPGSLELLGCIWIWFQTKWANQFSSVPQWCPIFCNPWTAACEASLSIANSWSLPKLMSIGLVMPSNHFIFSHPLLLLPPIFPSIRVLSNESVLHIRWSKYWSFHFSISPSNEYSGLISFRMVLLDLLAEQGTLKSLFQHHSSKTSILWRFYGFVNYLH